MSGGDFQGKSVVITGAGGGLGRALVAAFLAEGAKVTACDRDRAIIENLGAKHLRSFDLSDRAAADAAAQTILTKDGTPDILINNAGWSRAETMGDLTADAIGAEVDLNLISVMRFANPIINAMAARGNGAVVFISSVNSLGHFGNPAYAAAKAGIDAYMRAVAVEFGRRGVRANSVCPGSIRTPAWDHRFARDPDIPAKLARHYPLGRIVEPGEVVAAVTFLASPRASGITGVALPVDAGLTAGSRPFIDEILGG